MKLSNFNYLICSILFICFFVFIYSIYYEPQSKQKSMDAYYLLEYKKAYKSIFHDRIAIDLDEITNKAVEDGYKHWEIDTLRKKAMDNEYALWIQIQNKPSKK